jgi:hypothetical protein
MLYPNPHAYSAYASLKAQVCCCCLLSDKTKTEAEFSDEIQSKVLRVFLLAIHSHLCSFALRFIFLQNHTTSYSLVKETGGKPDRKPYPLSDVLRNPCRNLQVWKLSRLYLGYTFLSFQWKTGFSQKHKIDFQLQHVYCVQHLLIINVCNTINYILLYFACFYKIFRTYTVRLITIDK